MKNKIKKKKTLKKIQCNRKIKKKLKRTINHNNHRCPNQKMQNNLIYKNKNKRELENGCKTMMNNHLL